MKALNAVKRRAANALQSVKARAVALRPAAAVAIGTGLSMAGQARAATFSLDTSEVVATIAGAVTALTSIGMAVLSLVVVIRLFKWAQRTL